MASSLRRNYLPAAVILCGAALSICLFAFFRNYEHDQALDAFQDDSENHFTLIQREIDLDLQVLSSLKAFYAASEEVTREEFREFASSLLVDHKGIQALEWIPRVPLSRRRAYEAKARSDGYAGFRLTERSGPLRTIGAAPRAEYFPVYFMEPYKGNEPAMGFDVASQATRREALEKSRDTGQMVATSRVRLVQEKGDQFGILVFMPLYRKGVPTDSVETRRAALIGFVLGVFRIGDMLEESLAGLKQNTLDIALYDESAPEAERFLYHHAGGSGRQYLPSTDQAYSKAFYVAGHKWLLTSSPVSRGGIARSGYASWIVLLAGLLLTALLARNIRTSANRVRIVENLVAERSKELEETYKALSQSETKYRTIFESMEDIYYEADAEGTIRVVSPSAARLSGWKPEELIGRPVTDVYVEPADRDDLLSLLMRERFVKDYELRLKKKDGTLSEVSVGAQILFDEDGYISGVAGILRDITERKQAQEALKTSEQKYRSIFENAMEGIFQSTTEGKFISVNPALARIHLYDSPEEMIRHVDNVGRQLWVSSEEWKRYVDALKKNEAVNFEAEQYRKDGTTCWLSLTTRAIKDEKQKIILYEGMVRDITEQKKFEEALEKSEEKYRELVQNANSIIMRRDIAGGVTFFNEFAQHFFGYTEKEIIGKNVVGTIVPEYESTGRSLKSLIEDIGINPDCHANNINENMNRKGERFWIAWTNKPVYNDEGQVIEILCIGNDITERKRAEEELRREKNFSQTLVQSSPAFFVAISPDGKTIMMNDALLTALGYTGAEVAGRDYLTTFVPESDRGPLSETFLDIVHLQKSTVNENHILTRQGGQLLVEWHGRPIFNETGEMEYFFGVGIDITDRKRAEARLRESEELYRVAIESSNDGVALLKGADLIYANQKYLNMFGYDNLEEALHTDRFLRIHPDDRQIVKDYTAKRQKGEPAPSSYECRGIGKTGETIYMEVSVTKVIYLGEPAFLAYLRDVTERKTQEEERAKLWSAVERAGEGVFMLTPDKHYSYVNMAFCSTYDFTREELLGESTAIMRSDRHPKSFHNSIWNGLREGKTYSGRQTRKKKDGTLIDVETTIAPVLDASGAVIHYVGVERNITEQLQIEDQLRQAQKMEAIGTLAGGVAHDFNNILAVIMGLGNLIQMTIGRDDRNRPYIDQIVLSSEKAAELTQSLLAFSRKQKINLELHDVSGVIQSTAKLLKRLLPEDIELKLDLADEDLVALLDISQIDQVLMNLATNARDAMPEGGSLTIRTERAKLGRTFKKTHGFGKPGKYVRISVSDTGTGMDEQTITHVFEPFFTTKKIGKGTGLGLASAYGIVKQHDGYITVTSSLFAGSAFDIYLPMVEATAETGPTAGAEIRGGSETILVIEDDADVRNMVRDILSSQGYRAIEATDGADGIRVFNEHKDEVSLIILDVVMPGKNGKDVLEEINRIHPDVKAVFMSGYTGDVVIEKGIRRDNVDFMQKPLSVQTLLAKVREVLDR
jgi:PAS domain S-box-containing protein